MRVVRGLGHKDAIGLGGGFDEVVGSHVDHDFCAGDDLDLEFVLELAERLLILIESVVTSRENTSFPLQG